MSEYKEKGDILQVGHLEIDDDAQAYLVGFAFANCKTAATYDEKGLKTMGGYTIPELVAMLSDEDRAKWNGLV